MPDVVLSRGPSGRLWLLVVVVAICAGLALGAPGVARADNPTATVRVVDSGGNGLAGVTVSYGSTNGGFSTLGVTDSDGKVSGPVSWPYPQIQFLASYNHGSAVSALEPIGDLGQVVNFQTASVVLANPGVVYSLNANQGWTTYTGPMQMFPGQYTMNDGHGSVGFTVGASGFTGGILRLVDHNGNGLAGGTASYYLGGWSSLPGTTDANGNLAFSIPGDSPNLSMAMYYGGTRNQQNRGQLTASDFTFQTALANVKLENADGNPLDTGGASYYAGSWHTIGDTSGGVVSQEMLPGSYSFVMGYNHTRQQRDGVAITGPTTDVVFQTGRLTAYFSQPFSWNNSQFYPFDGPTMEFLPGNIQLDLAGCQTAWIPIAAGDHLVRTGIVATLADSAGHPLAGGGASVYAGGWGPVGTTDSQGRACAVVNGKRGNTAVAMTYNGTRRQISQDAQSNSIYAFRTADVAVHLDSSAGNPLDTGGASYYAGGWHPIGDTSGGVAHVQMLPGSYSFAMTYNGTREQKNQQAISGTSDSVTFSTTDVAVTLRDHTGATLSDPGSASYYAGGWHTIGDTSGGAVHVQMLPGSYSFAMTYKGTRDQLNAQHIGGTTDTVGFQTGQVNSATGSATSYYAGAWRPFTNGMELLSGQYWFHFNDGTAQTRETIQGGAVNAIH